MARMTCRRAGDVEVTFEITGPASWWAHENGAPRRDPIWALDPDGDDEWDDENQEWLPAMKQVGEEPLFIRVEDEIMEVLRCVEDNVPIDPPPTRE